MPNADFAAAQHASRHAAGGPDAVTPQSINAAAATHSHSADDIAGTNTGRGLLSLASRAAIRGYVGDVVSSLSGTDLNTMLTAGVWYVFQNNTNVPPVTDQRGYFEVIRYNDSYVLQRWTTFAPSAESPLNTWQRVRMASTWSAWSPMSPLDTGWIDVDWLPEPGSVGYSAISFQRYRQIGPRVTFSFSVDIAPAGRLQRSWVVPEALRPSVEGWGSAYPNVFSNGANSTAFSIFINTSGTMTFRSLDVPGTGTVNGYLEWLVD